MFALAVAVLATDQALPGGGLPWLIWIALAPLAWILWQATPFRAAGLAYLYGLLGWTLAIFGWAGAAEAMFGLPPLAAYAATLALAAMQAAPFALAGWLTAALSSGMAPSGPSRRIVGFAAAGTVALSWLPGFLPGNPAHALYRDPAAIQLLALGGTPLLLFVLLLVNGLLADALRRRRWAPALLAAGIVAAVHTGGAGRLAWPDAAGGPSLRIAGIQPAIGIGAFTAWSLPEDRTRAMDHVTGMTEAAAAMTPPPDLIVWAEQPVIIAPEQEPTIHAWLGGLARRLGRPILVAGAAASDIVYPNGVAGDLNRVWLYDAQGVVTGRHDKVRLVPFAEYLPLEDELPWLRSLLPFPRYTRAGGPAAPIDVGHGVRAIVAICYEAIFPDEMRAQARAGGTIILNPVNDLWFGTSRLSDFHLALASFRAVELGIPVARVTNSGQTAFFDGLGRVAADAFPPAGQPAIATAVLTPAPATTPYARLGDAGLWLLTAGLALALLPRTGRRRAVRQGSP